MKKIALLIGFRRGYKLLQSLLERDDVEIVSVNIQKEDKHETEQYVDKIMELCNKSFISHSNTRTRMINADLIFVCGWRRLILPEIYNKIPCYAVHESLLPKYRGFAPINWAIINGESEFGVTLFKIRDGEVDSGDIVKRCSIIISERKDAKLIKDKIEKEIIEMINHYLDGEYSEEPTKQDESQATYTCKRTPDDGIIDWNKSAKDVYNLIRALVPPYPCARIYDTQMVLITRATYPIQKTYEGYIPGRVIKILDDGVMILCGDGGQVIINDIIINGKEIKANEYWKSIRDTL